MRQPSFRQLVRAAFLSIFGLGAMMGQGTARGDQVEMVNGDRYVGRVLSLGSDVLVIQNEFLGTVKLPRARIANIALESPTARAGTNTLRVAPNLSHSPRVAPIPGRVPTNAAPDFASAMHELGTNSSVIQQVQQQFLAGAGPEAQTKFNDLVTGLMSGKVGVNELRVEARNTLEQAKSARKELGEEGGSSMDSYLAILETFLKESEPAITPASSPTNSLPATPKPEKPAADE